MKVHPIVLLKITLSDYVVLIQMTWSIQYMVFTICLKLITNMNDNER